MNKLIIAFLIICSIIQINCQEENNVDQKNDKQYDPVDSLKERSQFNRDHNRLKELMNQVDTIIEYLNSEDAKTLTDSQYNGLLQEISSIESEIKLITASYKLNEDL